MRILIFMQARTYEGGVAVKEGGGVCLKCNYQCRLPNFLLCKILSKRWEGGGGGGGG